MLRFKFVFFLFQLSIFFFITQAEEKSPYEYIFENSEEYVLPPLNFGLSELEPYLGESTLRAHYLGHHEGYKNKMNNFLKQWREKTSDELSGKSLFDVLNYLEKVPLEFQTAITNNVGGYVNHAIYWSIMSPNTDKILRTPSEGLKTELENDFESFEKFKEEFTSESLKLFGSGYVWLVLDISSEGDSLKIISSINQDSPISENLFPILVIDIWEHAYYLQHQFRRANHIEDFWFLVDWTKVEKLRNFWSEYLKTHSVISKEEL